MDKVTDMMLPPFLRQTQAQIMAKFIDLDRQQRKRLVSGARSIHPPSPWARLSNTEVARRNRYVNIQPWDANRVHLSVPPDESDYINASPIKLRGTKGLHRFIATQGPKQLSIAHYWSMIWHSSPPDMPAVIVMLTQTHDAGREKCSLYFPTDDTPIQANILPTTSPSAPPYFAATVSCIDTHFDTTSAATIRKLDLRVGDVTKTVWHYLFSGWPDFLIPSGEQRTALLSLVHDTAARAVDGAPRIVHCSAGVGRSGTFIALDYLLAELEAGAFDALPKTERAWDPVLACVDDLRRQRMMMVQGEVQFLFLYDVLRAQYLRRMGRSKDNADTENAS